MMKTIAIIPARGGSKRLPNKNILLLGGIPLIAHSILYAQQQADWIDGIFVSTDDPEIKKMALSYGASVIDRPASLSGDFEPTVSAIKHAIEGNETVENIVLLQPTNPLRPANLLKDCFRVYEENQYNSLFTVSRSHQKLGKIEQDVFVPFNYTAGQRSQDMEPLFYENGLIYISKAKIIRENQIMSPTAFPFVVDHVYAGVDIDTQEDFNYAAYILNQEI